MKSMRAARPGPWCSAIMTAVVSVGCLQRLPPLVPGEPREFERLLLLNGHQLTVHLTTPARAAQRSVILYATGDGGWRGKDVDTYRRLVSMGHPTAGFSSPEYLKYLGGGSETTTPARLALDYDAIIDFSKTSLMLSPDTPVILVGVSRGAGLAVVAAGQGLLRRELSGVVAIGLTREEEHVHRFTRRLQRSGEPQARSPIIIQTYQYLRRLGSQPISVIQSTRDNYLPADAARLLFGPDTERRQFHAIDARNHGFGNARPLLYDAIQASLVWIDRLTVEARLHQ
jgi:pimeloyl-ACP methyl ester carboxylesterase